MASRRKCALGLALAHGGRRPGWEARTGGCPKALNPSTGACPWLLGLAWRRQTRCMTSFE